MSAQQSGNVHFSAEIPFGKSLSIGENTLQVSRVSQWDFPSGTAATATAFLAISSVEESVGGKRTTSARFELSPEDHQTLLRSLKDLSAAIGKSQIDDERETVTATIAPFPWLTISTSMTEKGIIAGEMQLHGASRTFTVRDQSLDFVRNLCIFIGQAVNG